MMKTALPIAPPSTPRPLISGVIVARNEEDKIAFALESLRSVVDEIVFFDMESSDRTGEIAASYGAKVFCVPAVGAQEPARAVAVEEAAGPWILLVDADELLSAELCKRVLEIVTHDEAEAVSLPRQNYLFGKVMTGALMGPNDDSQLRLFKKGSVTLSPLLLMHHPPTIMPGVRVLNLIFPRDGAIIHFNYLDIDNYLVKFSRYTRFHALESDAGKKYSSAKTFLKAGYEFLNRYLCKGGYRDGWRGLYISLSMSFYRLTIWARVQELREVGDAGSIRGIYDREAKAALRRIPSASALR